MPPDHIEHSLSLLLIQICKAHRGAAEQNLNCIGLHAGQEMLMMQLWEQDGQTQTQLAEKMGVQPPTLNKMLTRMESSGLVLRRTDAEDNRVSRVYLTDESRRKQREVEQAWAQLEQRTLANLTLDERVLLRRLLLQVHANLTQGE